MINSPVLMGVGKMVVMRAVANYLTASRHEKSNVGLALISSLARSLIEICG